MVTNKPKIPVWCAGEEWCPVTSVTTLIGRKWHPVIIHRLLANGPLGFNDLKTEVDGISSKVLSDALEDLEDKGLIDREITNEKPVRVSYSLTELGASLESVIFEMQDWGMEHLEPAEDKSQSAA